MPKLYVLNWQINCVLTILNEYCKDIYIFISLAYETLLINITFFLLHGIPNKTCGLSLLLPSGPGLSFKKDILEKISYSKERSVGRPP